MCMVPVIDREAAIAADQTVGQAALPACGGETRTPT